MSEESKEYFPDELGSVEQLAIFSLMLDEKVKTPFFVSQYFKILSQFSSYGVVHIKNFTVPVNTEKCLVLLESVDHPMFSHVVSISAKVNLSDVITIGLFCIKEPIKSVLSFFETNGNLMIQSLKLILSDEKRKALLKNLPNIPLQYFEKISPSDQELCFRCLSLSEKIAEKDQTEENLALLSKQLRISEESLKKVWMTASQISLLSK